MPQKNSIKAVLLFSIFIPNGVMASKHLEKDNLGDRQLVKPIAAEIKNCLHYLSAARKRIYTNKRVT